jgi:hypothetical protein
MPTVRGCRLPPDDSTVAVRPYQGALNGVKTTGPLSSGRKQFRYMFGRIKRTSVATESAFFTFDALPVGGIYRGALTELPTRAINHRSDRRPRSPISRLRHELHRDLPRS